MAESRHQVTVPPRLNGVRLDKAVAELLNLPRSQVSRLWQAGLVRTTDNRLLKPAQAASAGDKLVVDIPPPVPTVVTAESLTQLDIIFEDEDILVINKPAGLIVHPSTNSDSQPTLADLLHHARPAIKDARYSDSEGDRRRAGLVHRLDKDTSGVMIVAKTANALETLKTAFKERRVAKQYHAVCAGDLSDQIVDEPLGRHPRRWWLRAVVATGKPAQTTVSTVKRGELYRQPASLVIARPKTGRTHQIRVHLAHLGCPILGDNRYATTASSELTRLANVPRLMLHASQLDIPHPITGEALTFTAPLPSDIAAVASQINPV